MSARDRVLEYYRKQIGIVPEWVDLLSKYMPEALDGLTKFRDGFMEPPTPALTRKETHLLIMVLDAATGNGSGGAVHARLAVEQGATAKQVAQALSLTMMVCGVPTFEKAGREILKAAETKENELKGKK
jgi:alkylhydroperoxidase/carboxymuconolactone decarboxylase family protein YurZ